MKKAALNEIQDALEALTKETSHDPKQCELPADAGLVIVKYGEQLNSESPQYSQEAESIAMGIVLHRLKSLANFATCSTAVRDKATKLRIKIGKLTNNVELA